uniref:GDNF family receptor alpha 2 n=1 Tax=Cynoglossus semilaevis TaxID=244447 RepID=A0A3P8WBD5_CYNSE
MKSVTVWMCVHICLLLLDGAAGSWEGPSSLSLSLSTNAPASTGAGSGPRAQSEWVDCIQASDMCNQNPHCSSRYRVMRQCLVGKEKEVMLDNNRECQAALEVLLVSPLYDCRCKRGMKKELQCLQNYWTIHMGLNEGMLTVAPKGFQCPDAEKNCNPCLDAAKACNLNNSCKKQRSSYIAICSKGETCSKRRCHRALRMFLDRVHPEFSHRLLFCPCQTEGCAERRRQTIVPDCSYIEGEKPNCLELRKICRQDSLCRSRLADYLANCWMPPHTASTCPNQDNHQACLSSFTRLIGTEMTPNYVDNRFSDWVISPWCTCEGSGNQEEECMNFLHYFTNNTCLRNAIQAFGYGMDSMQNKSVSVPAPPPTKTGWYWSNDTLERPFVNVQKYPEPRDGGNTQRLPEDRSAFLHVNVWAVLPSLVLALVLAQHAL